jgi:signal transduction histidine kinase
MRHRLLVGHICIALVICIGAATSVVALRWTAQQSARSQRIDEKLTVLDRLRLDLRELSIAVRGHVLQNDVPHQQRVFDVLQRIAAEREELQARATLRDGGPLEADIEDYVAALLSVMAHETPDPMARIVHFEEELARVRTPLSSRFDAVLRTERAQRDSARQIQTLAMRAQWAVVIASILGIVLVVVMAKQSRRSGQERAPDLNEPPQGGPRLGDGPAPQVEPTVLRF